MNRTEDLTRGKVKNQIAALAFPLLLGNLLQQLYNTIDAFIVGKYVGETAFAAIGVAGSVMNLFIFIMMGACNGVSLIFAELYGRKDWKSFRRESFLSLSVGGLFAAVLSAAGLVTLHPLLEAIQTPEEVVAFAYQYLWVIYLGLPATFLYNWCSAVLRAAGDTNMALRVLAAAMILNLGLDFGFTIVLHMGISGTAKATVLSQLFASIVCLGYMKGKYPHLLLRFTDIAFDRGLLWKTACYGMTSALHQSSLYIGKLLVQGVVNTAGTEIISAYTAGTRIEGFANSFGDSGSAAISIFVAQNKGAGKEDRVKYGFRKGIQMMAVLGICLSLLMLFTVKSSISLFLADASDQMLKNAQAYMGVIAVFYTLCFIGNSFVGLFKGLGMVHVPVLGTLLHISIRVILSHLFLHALGLSAIAAATGVGWIAVVIFFFYQFKNIR